MKTVFGALLGTCLMCASASADLMLFLSPNGPTTLPVGGTLDIDIELSETATSILTTDGLFAGAVLLVFDVPGIATLNSISAGPGFDDFSDVNTSELVVEASGATVMDNPMQLGTITITGSSPGTTTITTADPNPEPSFIDFLSGAPAGLDAEVFATTASLTITVIPEPSAFAAMAFVALAALACRGVLPVLPIARSCTTTLQSAG